MKQQTFLAMMNDAGNILNEIEPEARWIRFYLNNQKFITALIDGVKAFDNYARVQDNHDDFVMIPYDSITYISC